MRAKDIMTTQVATVTPDTPIRGIAGCLVKQHISGVPVTDDEGRVLGIVSESDLIHRVAAANGQHRSWWASLFSAPGSDPAEFVKVHGIRARDIMTRAVISVTEDTPVEEVARLLEERRIKRVPVVREGRLVGVLSRADLLRVILASPEAGVSMSADDKALRERIMANLADQNWAHTSQFNIVVSGGIAHLWGFVASDTEGDAVRVAAEEVPGIQRVEDHLNRSPMPWSTSRGKGFGGAGGIV